MEVKTQNKTVSILVFLLVPLHDTIHYAKECQPYCEGVCYLDLYVINSEHRIPST